MSSTSQIQQAFVSLAVLASVGTMVHENKLTRALQLSAPLSNFSVNLSSNLEGLHEASSAHTHLEQSSINKQFSASTTRVQPRDDHKKYALPKTTSRNNTYMGDSAIVWPSV